MSELAEPFTALGVGNGFPFCVQKVNVSLSSVEDWITFSGVSKTSPTTTPALIAESLKLAMQWFWNAYSINVFMKSAIVNSNNPNNDFTLEFSGERIVGSTFQVQGSFTNDTQNPNIEPYKQVCPSAGVAFGVTSGRSIIYSNQPISGYNVRAGATFTPRALYDGDPTNENNFKGYGAIGENTNSGTIANGGIYCASIASSSWYKSIIYSGATLGGPKGKTSISYEQLSSGHWLVKRISEDYPDTPENVTVTAEAEFNGLSFYTYA
jgi:hypothetical protein